MAFLNETGLATFLSYLKAWARATFASKTDTQTIEGATTFSQTVTGNITGNAGTATKLKTARTINGVAFNGSANITVADSTKLPLSGGTLTGPLYGTDPGSSSNDAKIPTTAWVRTYCETTKGFLSGTVPIANGGTGSTTKNFVDLSSDQAISGIKTFNSDIYIGSLGKITTSGNLVKRENNSSLFVCGGQDNKVSSGSYIMLNGVSSGDPGVVYIRTGNVSNSYSTLQLTPSGTLSWNGQPLQSGSDERLKTPLAAVPDEVLDAWEDVQWGQFQYLDAVDAKGESARLHLGLIAQRVNAAFKERGLDACEYGILCYEEEEDLWMVRYTEALAMEAACQRRRADRLEARIKALEEAHA